MPRLRDLSLNAKLTLALLGVFGVTAAVFLLLLLPLQRQQAERLLAQDKRLVTTLRDTYQRDLIYDILSANDPSLEVSLAELARQPGVLWVRLEAGPRALAATADGARLRRLLGAAAPAADEALAPVLLLRGDGRAATVGAGGRPLADVAAPPLERLPDWRSGAEPAFVEAPLERAGGETALYALFDLRAAETPYGRLHLLYSLAEQRRSATLARTLFAGLVGTSFALLLVVLNLLVARIVIAPVRRVMQAMREASTGALEARLPVHSGDEIGSMAASFNRMVADLQASKREIEGYSRNLEGMVAERTGALLESEAALLRVKTHLATVLANVGTGVISLDPEGRVLTLNRRAAEILHLGSGPAEGRPLARVLPSGAVELARLTSAAGAAPSGRAEDRLTLRLPQGRRTLSAAASVLRDEGGRRAGSVVVFEDLTELLATQRLEAWKQAVERVIHEIKNPLTPVGLAAETLQSAYERDRARFDQMFPAACRMILQSVSDLKALIAEFTQFSRLPRAVVRRLDLNALVRETLALYESAPPEGLRLELRLDPALPAVDGDAEQLRRVLLNVAHNGFEAMAGRGGALTVASASAGAEVQLRISDQGQGVEDVERLFEPYYTTKAKGTGLGLLIARQIVEEHGGRIAIESRLGQGTEVLIALPAAGEPPAALTAPGASD